MPERAMVFESTRIGVESVPGTPVTATKRLLSTEIAPAIEIDSKVYRPRGSRYNTTGVVNKEWSTAAITQEVASYTDTAYLLSGAFGSPNIVVPGGGTLARELTWDPGLANFTAVDPKTLTVESGSFKRAQKFAYGLITGLGMDYDRDGVSLSGDMIGQLVTDGITLSGGTNEVQTLTVTGTPVSGSLVVAFMGEQFTIAYNATSGAVQTAIDALSNVDSGDITVAGGALPGTPLTFTFAGKYAKLNVPMLVVVTNSLGGGTSPLGTFTQTTPGAALTSLPMQPISGNEWNIYVDTLYTNIGTTQLTRCFSCGWNVSDLFGPVWVGDRSQTSWAAHVDLAPSTEFKMTVEADSTGMGFLTDLRENDVLFVRINALGDEIESGQNYLMQTDLCVQLTDIGDYADEDGVVAVEFTGELFYDETWGSAQKFLMRNAITSIT